MRSAEFDTNQAIYLREKAKLNQRQLAEQVAGLIGRDFHPSNISHIETGLRQPTYEVAEAICKALGVDESELIRPKAVA
jgi:transcriptional regulator with XRE-family HTH domain